MLLGSVTSGYVCCLNGGVSEQELVEAVVVVCAAVACIKRALGHVTRIVTVPVCQPVVGAPSVTVRCRQ
jgi:hypothetical protein